MNKRISSLILALIVTSPLAGLGQAGVENDPAYLPIDKVLDLKTMKPQVNINLPRFLLKDAASELSSVSGVSLEGSGVDFGELIKDVKLIRLVVIEADKENRLALDKAMKKLRTQVEAKWTPIVSVPEDNVGVYALSDPSGESTAGLAVLIYDDGDAVIGNIVGRVPIGKLIKIASQMDKLPKEVLKKLQGIGNQRNNSPAGGANRGVETNKPVEKAEAPAKEPATK
jgi:hypothetical protein